MATRREEAVVIDGQRFPRVQLRQVIVNHVAVVRSVRAADVAVRGDRWHIGDSIVGSREEQRDELAHSPVERVHRPRWRTRRIARWRGVVPYLLGNHARRIFRGGHICQVGIRACARSDGIDAALAAEYGPQPPDAGAIEG